MIRSNTVQITPEILSLIAGIDEFKRAWRALGNLAPDRLSALRRVAYVPFSSLESVIEHNTESYYLALRQTQSSTRSKSPDSQPWLVFFLRALKEQVARLQKKAEREKIVLAALPALSL